MMCCPLLTLILALPQHWQMGGHADRKTRRADPRRLRHGRLSSRRKCPVSDVRFFIPIHFSSRGDDDVSCESLRVRVLRSWDAGGTPALPVVPAAGPLSSRMHVVATIRALTTACVPPRAHRRLEEGAIAGYRRDAGAAGAPSCRTDGRARTRAAAPGRSSWRSRRASTMTGASPTRRASMRRETQSGTGYPAAVAGEVARLQSPGPRAGGQFDGVLGLRPVTPS